jgi:magnesium transporter
LNAIKNPFSAGSPKSPDVQNVRSSQNLLDRLALGRAIVNGTNETTGISVDNAITSESGSSNQVSLPPVDETEPLDDLVDSDYKEEHPADCKEAKINQQRGAVTYRERLGGFLHPRDMRKLVTPFSASNEPELIVRRHAMLLNFDPLRAIILRDRLLVLVPDGADSILVQLERRVRGASESGGFYNTMSHSESSPSLDDEVSNHSSKNATTANSGVPKNGVDIKAAEASGIDREELNVETSTDSTEQLGAGEGGLPDYAVGLDENELFVNAFVDTEWQELEGKDWIDLTFELQSVDAVLHCVAAILADDVLDLQLGANSMISELVHPGADVGDHAQELFRTMKNSVKEIVSRVDGFCRALDTVLEDYEDMALMNLSRLLTHPDRFVQPVPQATLEEESDEPELILEAHLQRGHTLTNALSLVQGQINSTEDFAVRKSDTIRNRLLYINMVVSVVSLSVGLGSFIGSMYGMK